MRRLLSLLLGLVLLGAPAATVLTLTEDGHTVQTRGTESPRVRVATVEVGSEARPQRFYGVTRATDRALLAFTLGGRLEERPVDVGDVVDAGDVLAELDRSPMRHARSAASARVDQLQAELAQRQRDVRRSERLYEVDVIGQQQHEQARTAQESLVALLEGAEAEYGEARRRLREATLRAPFAGTVTEVLVEPDELVSPGQPVVLLSGEGGVEVEIEVPESTFGALSLDTPVLVDLPMAGRSGLLGRIAHLGTSGAGPGRLFPVVVRLDVAAGVRPGMTADIVLSPASPDALTVPIAAVIDPSGQAPAVLRVPRLLDEERRNARHRQADDLVVERVPVRPGALIGDRVTVRGGLLDGDLVVVAGHALLEHGETVSLAPPVPTRGPQPEAVASGAAEQSAEVAP